MLTQLGQKRGDTRVEGQIETVEDVGTEWD